MIKATLCALWYTAISVVLLVNLFRGFAGDQIDIIPLALLLAAGVLFVACNPRGRV